MGSNQSIGTTTNYTVTYKLTKNNTNLTSLMQNKGVIKSLRLVDFKQTFGNPEETKFYITITNFSSNKLQLFDDPNTYLMGSFVVKQKDNDVEIAVDTTMFNGTDIEDTKVTVVKQDEKTGTFGQYNFGEYGNCEFEVSLEVVV